MRISLLDLRRGLEQAELSAPPESLDLPQAWFNRPVALALAVRAVPGGWKLDLEVRTRVDRTCDRCLAELDLPVAEKESCLVLEDGSIGSEEERVLPVAPDQEWVELDQVVRDGLILSQPEYLLCRDDCRGLCPQCGQDLNEGDCGCRPPLPDSPLQVLAGLKRP